MRRKLKFDQAYYWPAWLLSSLEKPKPSLLSSSLVRRLCVANNNLWLALNLYDDCLDTPGAVTLLPQANRLYRAFLTTGLSLGYDQHFYRVFHHTLNRLDAANTKELTKFRLTIRNGKIILPTKQPNFGPLSSLADKSLALALAPAAVLYTLPALPGSQQKAGLSKLMNFFRLALAAKQLADDIKDWRTDLAAGHLTRANWLIIKNLKQKSISLEEPRTVYKLETIFIHTASTELSQQLAGLCYQARRATKDCGLRESGRLVQKILGPMENGIRETAALRAWLNESEM